MNGTKSIPRIAQEGFDMQHILHYSYDNIYQNRIARHMQDTLVRSKPLYRQLGARLESKILSGELAAGDRLPTTQEIATSG
ncbi:MAG: GntR family transcriptional regulator [Lentisphaerae bacterium]|nr:GntR family transcriptional regulator [Lentisphaerota bacterium]